MRAETIDAVIGVDTHTDTHTACLIDHAGREVEVVTVAADPAGYRRLIAWAARLVAQPGLIWAVEGCRSHGAGLTRALQTAGQIVVEAGQPERVGRRPGGKSDPVDARLAARTALAATRHAQPRGDGDREALRILLVARDHANHPRTAAINLFKSLVLTAPDQLRERLRHQSTLRQTAACIRLRIHPRHSTTEQVLRATLRDLASQIRSLERDIRANDKQLHQLVAAIMPALLDQPGVGPVCAAHLLIARSHPADAAPRQHWPPSPESAHYPPHPDTPSATDPTASATAPSTAPCTPSSTGA
jgi:transposase